jgi:hypothetical protein
VSAVIIDESRTFRWPVTASLLEEGINTAVLATRTRIGQATGELSGLDLSPGPRCTHCPIRSSCEQGQAWLLDPDRRVNGFPKSA